MFGDGLHGFWGDYHHYGGSAKFNKSDQFDSKHKVVDEKSGRTESKGAEFGKVEKRPKAGDNSDSFDFFDANSSESSWKDLTSAKFGSRADHYNRQQYSTRLYWPTVDEVVGSDLVPSDDKKKWPAFKGHKDWNKNFHHFADSDSWPFREHGRKYPWHGGADSGSHRLGRGYGDSEESSEQAARKSVESGFDPRDPAAFDRRSHFGNRVGRGFGGLDGRSRRLNRGRGGDGGLMDGMFSDSLKSIDSINDPVYGSGDPASATIFGGDENDESVRKLREIRNINSRLEEEINNEKRISRDRQRGRSGDRVAEEEIERLVREGEMAGSDGSGKGGKGSSGTGGGDGEGSTDFETPKSGSDGEKSGKSDGDQSDQDGDTDSGDPVSSGRTSGGGGGGSAGSSTGSSTSSSSKKATKTGKSGKAKKGSAAGSSEKSKNGSHSSKKKSSGNGASSQDPDTDSPDNSDEKSIQEQIEDAKKEIKVIEDLVNN